MILKYRFDKDDNDDDDDDDDDNKKLQQHTANHFFLLAAQAAIPENFSRDRRDAENKVSWRQESGTSCESIEPAI